MKEKLGWEPTFPIQTLIYKGGIEPGEIDQTYFGMSIRLKLAAMAMQGLCVGKITSEIKKGECCDIAEMALLIADELLKQESL